MSALLTAAAVAAGRAADEAKRAAQLAEAQALGLPPDPRVDLWTGYVGEVLVIIGTYHGVLDVQARVRGSKHWHPASPDLEAQASVRALEEKPWIEDELRAGVLERLRARARDRY